MNTKKRFWFDIGVLFTVFLLLFFVPEALANHSTSGTVAGDRPYTYTVKCAPGDSFSISVRSDYPTSVDILFMTPHGNEWAQNSVSGSDQRTTHELSWKAPDGKPSNNAAYHHYKVSILASTNHQTKFSLDIRQQGSGKKLDAEYVKLAQGRLKQLIVSLDGEKKRVESEAKIQIERVKLMEEEMNKLRGYIESSRSELASLKAQIQSEQNKAVRSSLRQTHEHKRLNLNDKINQYNQMVRDKNSIVSEFKSKYTARLTEISDLRKSIIRTWENKDVDKCVLIANGSQLARQLGWNPIKRK